MAHRRMPGKCFVGVTFVGSVPSLQRDNLSGGMGLREAVSMSPASGEGDIPVRRLAAWRARTEQGAAALHEASVTPSVAGTGGVSLPAPGPLSHQPLLWLASLV